MSATGSIKVSARTHSLIRLGANVNHCTLSAFVDEAVAEFIANHQDEIQAGVENARQVLTSAGHTKKKHG